MSFGKFVHLESINRKLIGLGFHVLTFEFQAFMTGAVCTHTYPSLISEEASLIKIIFNCVHFKILLTKRKCYTAIFKLGEMQVRKTEDKKIPKK